MKTVPVVDAQEIPPPVHSRPVCWRRHALRQAWLYAVGAVAALLLAHLFPQDSQPHGDLHDICAWPAFLFRTFTFHIGLVAALELLVAIRLRARWLALTLALIVLPTVGGELLKSWPRTAPPAAGPTLRVMTLNVLRTSRTYGAAAQAVRAVAPDLLLLQEYSADWRAALEPQLLPLLPAAYAFTPGDCRGIGLYARAPLTDVDGALPLPIVAGPQARAVLDLGGRPVAVYNVHMLPPTSLHAFGRQRRQFAKLLELLRAEQLPIVLCGDFNFTDASYCADALRRLGLRDVHDLGGYGRRATWHHKNPWLGWIPGLRLDHLYLSPALTSPRSDLAAPTGSDHRPVVAEIGFR